MFPAKYTHTWDIDCRKKQSGNEIGSARIKKEVLLCTIRFFEKTWLRRYRPMYYLTKGADR